MHALLLVSEIRTVAADNLLMSGYAAASRPAARAWPRNCGKGARQLQCRSQRAGEAHPHACILCADLKQTHMHPYTRARAHTHEHIPSFTRGSKSPTHTWPAPSDKYDPSCSSPFPGRLRPPGHDRRRGRLNARCRQHSIPDDCVLSYLKRRINPRHSWIQLLAVECLAAVSHQRHVNCTATAQ